MDFSNEYTEPQGHKLIDEVVDHTGLPSAVIRGELDQILKLSGEHPADVTLEGLRKAMIAYLECFQDSFLKEEVSMEGDTSIVE